MSDTGAYVTTYSVESNTSLLSLIQQVNERISEGYVLQGGICVGETGYIRLYYQALTINRPY